MGYVYLVKGKGCDLHKIGSCSKPPLIRMVNLQIGSPVELELVHELSSPDFRQIERALHAAFASKRVRGEWFNLSLTDIRRIRKVKSLPQAPPPAPGQVLRSGRGCRPVNVQHEPPTHRISVEIQERCRAAGIPNAFHLSKRLKMSITPVYRLWNGVTRGIELNTLDKLCKLLRCRPPDIIVRRPIEVCK